MNNVVINILEYTRDPSGQKLRWVIWEYQGTYPIASLVPHTGAQVGQGIIENISV